jgi:hypothetical protein
VKRCPPQRPSDIDRMASAHPGRAAVFELIMSDTSILHPIAALVDEVHRIRAHGTGTVERYLV